MLCLESSKIDILFVMTDIDKHILTDIRAALSAIKEQIDVIDSRLERMTEICSGDADTLAEEPAAVLPVQAAEAAAVVVEEAFEDKVGVPAEEEALSGERENFFVGEEISLGGNLEMAFADSEPLENAETVNVIGEEETDAVEAVAEAVVEADEFAEDVAVVEENEAVSDATEETETIADDAAGAEVAAEVEEFAEDVATGAEVDADIIENEVVVADEAGEEAVGAIGGEVAAEVEEFAEDVATGVEVDADIIENEVVVADEAGEEAVGAIGREVAVAVEERVEPAVEKPKEPVRFAWRTDRPGSPVRNILSAISLNDRMLFIRTLFADDPALFQKTISVFNSLSSLAEAEAYIRSHFPKWDMSSDTVYRFMMAARRRFS